MALSETDCPTKNKENDETRRAGQTGREAWN